MHAIEAQLRQFIVDNFLFGQQNGFGSDTSLLKNGIIDSTGTLELITFLEATFGVKVEEVELIPENLDSVNKLMAFIERKQAHSDAGRTVSAS